MSQIMCPIVLERSSRSDSSAKCGQVDEEKDENDCEKEECVAAFVSLPSQILTDGPTCAEKGNLVTSRDMSEFYGGNFHEHEQEVPLTSCIKRYHEELSGHAPPSTQFQESSQSQLYTSTTRKSHNATSLQLEELKEVPVHYETCPALSIPLQRSSPANISFDEVYPCLHKNFAETMPRECNDDRNVQKIESVEGPEGQQTSVASVPSRFSLTFSWSSSDEESDDEMSLNSSTDEETQDVPCHLMHRQRSSTFMTGRWSAVSDLTGEAFHGEFSSKRTSEISFLLEGEKFLDIEFDQNDSPVSAAAAAVKQIGVALRNRVEANRDCYAFSGDNAGMKVVSPPSRRLLSIVPLKAKVRSRSAEISSRVTDLLMLMGARAVRKKQSTSGKRKIMRQLLGFDKNLRATE